MASALAPLAHIAPPVSGEFEAYPIQTQSPAVEGVNGKVRGIFADHGDIVDRPGAVASSLTGNGEPP